jgi:signal transduction histidine kinase
MNRQATIIFYILSVYVVVQFLWWGFHLIELTSAITEESELINKRVTMVIGEGIVFLLILLLGHWQIRRSIKKQLLLDQDQRNFMLSVTHELKTPLAANKLYLQTISKRDLDASKKQELIDRAIEENKRLEQMIDKILNATRLENKSMELSRETVDLQGLVKRIKERFQSFYPELEILVDIHDGIKLNADLFLLETVLNNLVENAIKYSNGKEITVYAANSDSSVTFGVKDNGNGVPMEIREQIFRKFYRSGDENTRTTKGTGLGLYVVKQICKLHGWNIRCLTNDPKGSNFQINVKNV